jgi:hypothetical protein
MYDDVVQDTCSVTLEMFMARVLQRPFLTGCRALTPWGARMRESPGKNNF